MAMSASGRTGRVGRALRLGALGLVAAVALAACAHMGMHMLMGGHAERPAASEFGLGPRPSTDGIYSATLEPAEPIRTRRLQAMRLVVTDSRRPSGMPSPPCS